MGVIFVKQDRVTMSAGTAGLHIRSVERSKQARERECGSLTLEWHTSFSSSRQVIHHPAAPVVLNCIVTNTPPPAALSSFGGLHALVLTTCSLLERPLSFKSSNLLAGVSRESIKCQRNIQGSMKCSRYKVPPWRWSVLRVWADVSQCGRVGGGAHPTVGRTSNLQIRTWGCWWWCSCNNTIQYNRSCRVVDYLSATARASVLFLC